MLISVCVGLTVCWLWAVCWHGNKQLSLSQLWLWCSRRMDGWMDGLRDWMRGWMRTLSACVRAWGALAVAWAFRKCSHALSVTVSPSLSFTWPGAISGSNRWVWRSRGTLSQSWVPYFQTCKGSHFSVIYKQVKYNKAPETQPTKSKHSGVTQQRPSIFCGKFDFNIFSSIFFVVVVGYSDSILI